MAIQPLHVLPFILVLAAAAGGYGLYRAWRNFRRRLKKRKKRARPDIVRDQINFFMKNDPGIARHLKSVQAEGLTGNRESDDAPRPGEPVPDLVLKKLNAEAKGDAARVRLADLAGHKPVVLLFGSYT